MRRCLVMTGVLFLLTTTKRLPPGSATKTLGQRLAPLKQVRVWRFGLYYFFVFGGFVALAQWLVPYYVNAYATTVALAGALAACNSLPSGVIRAFGGWLSDKFGARTVMYWVLGASLVCCLLLIVPQMDIRSPGSGIMAKVGGEVTSVTESEIIVEHKTGTSATYPLKRKAGELVSHEERAKGLLVLPRSMTWQESVVGEGQQVDKKELLARGVTQIFFQANIWVFTALSLILGAVMGIGKAAVYKHIPDYFPADVGVVGGIVGVLGGLGGFVCPGHFWLSAESNRIVDVLLDVLCDPGRRVCLVWMHLVVRSMMKTEAPDLHGRME